MQVSSFSIR